MAMLGLGLIITRYNGTGTCLSVPVRASDYWCRSIFDRLLYQTKVYNKFKSLFNINFDIFLSTVLIVDTFGADKESQGNSLYIHMNNLEVLNKKLTL